MLVAFIKKYSIYLTAIMENDSNKLCGNHFKERLKMELYVP